MGSFLKRDLAASKRFKARLKAGEVTTLINTNHPSPSLVERLAYTGFDAVLIEAEHGCVSRETVEEMSRAAALAGTAAIIRPEAPLPHFISGYIACGVDGFMLSLIQTPEQAQQLIDEFRHSAPMDYQDRIMILMIERIEAVENLPALLRLNGVDAFMVAQCDLALSMGEALAPDETFSQRVLDTIDRAVDQIVDSGRACGIRVTFEDVDRYVARGVTLVYEHTDHMIERGAKDFLSRIESGKRRRQ